MHVITLATQKGGAGKSTLAVSLAVAAAESGRKPTLVDLDPQGTTSNWYRRRQSMTKAEEPQAAAVTAAELPRAIAALRKQGRELVIIDTAGVDTPATAAAFQVSHLCLIPARPSAADVEASRPTVQSLLRLGKPFAFVLSQVPTGRSSRTVGAAQVLGMMGDACPVSIALRTDHMDSLAEGLGVTERAPAGKAAAEIRELMAWTFHRLESLS